MGRAVAIGVQNYNEIIEKDYFYVDKTVFIKEQPEYELMLTNTEVNLMFRNMVRDWFTEAESEYNDFVKALLLGDVKAMNHYMNRVH